MFDQRSRLLVPAAAVAVFIVASSTVTDARAAGRIVCWKDESGKVVGCGDRVPPDFRGGATKELDSHGITRKTTETREEAARRRAEEQELARKKAKERRRLAEQGIPREKIVRPSDISPGRQVDPGAGFPWDKFINEVRSDS